MEWENIPNNIEDYHGFLYCVYEKDTDMAYIGITKYWRINKKKIARKPTKIEYERLARYKIKNKIKYKEYKKELRLKYKGLKKTVCEKVETKWRTYNTSSGGNIIQDKLENNPDNYRKIILYNCKTQTELKCKECFMLLKIYFDGDWNKVYNENVNIKMRIRKNEAK